MREPNLLPVGGPYQIQAINALDYYINEADGKGKNICSFIQDDAYGEAGQSGVDFAAEQLGFKVVDTQKFKVGDKDVTGQVQRLQGSKCDAVFLVATPTDAGTIWGTAAKLGFAPRWIGQSPTWIDELGASPLAEYLQKTTWIVGEGTEWGDDSVPGHEGPASSARQGVQARPGARLLLRVRLPAGHRHDRAAREGGRARRPVARGPHEGVARSSGRSASTACPATTSTGRRTRATRRAMSTIYEVKPDKPFGLGTLEYQYESDAAKAFEFKKADL